MYSDVVIPLFLPCDGYHKTRIVVCLLKRDVTVVQLLECQSGLHYRYLAL